MKKLKKWPHRGIFTHRQHSKGVTHAKMCYTPLFRHFSMTKKSKITMDDSQQQKRRKHQQRKILPLLLIKHFHVKHVLLLYISISVFPNACLQNSYSIQRQLKNCTIDVSIPKYKRKILNTYRVSLGYDKVRIQNFQNIFIKK